MSSDIIYYNLQLGNDSDQTSGVFSPINQTLASIQTNSTIPIITNPDEYYCSIIRFQLSGFNIPLISFVIQTPVTDINLSIYSFTLTEGAFTSTQQFVQYTPQVQVQASMVPVVGTVTQNFKSQYYFVYDYTWMIKMFNTTLATANTALNAASGGAKAAPFFVYDPTTQLVSLYCVAADYDTATPGFRTVIFNNAVHDGVSIQPD